MCSIQWPSVTAKSLTTSNNPNSAINNLLKGNNNNNNNNKLSRNFDDRPHRMSCRYWGLNYPVRCVPLLTMKWSLSNPNRNLLFRMAALSAGLKQGKNAVAVKRLQNKKYITTGRPLQQRLPLLFSGPDNIQKLPLPMWCLDLPP